MLTADVRKRLKASTASAYARINVQAAKGSRSPGDLEVLQALERDFGPCNERLAELTGLDLTAWR